MALGFVLLNRDGMPPADGRVSVGGEPGRIRALVGAGLPQPGA